MHRFAIVALLLSTFATAVPAAAQTGQQLEVEAGVGQLDDEWLLSTRLAYYYFDEVGGIGCDPTVYGERGERCLAPVRVGLQLPVRFELQGSDIVREEDWDDPGDFFRFVRFLEYGEPHQPLHARFGELGGVVIGHGTIANGYLNTLTTGDFNPGFEASANTAYGGVHLVVGNVTEPYLFGGRGYVRPWGFGDRASWWHRLAIGLTTVSDFSAPVEVSSVDGELQVVDSTPVTVAGLDVELTAVESDVVELMPYVDFNLSQGVGGHLGANLHMFLGEEWTASLRLEGRLLGPQYLPDYFGPLYEVDRFRMTGWGAPLAAPKARIAASREESAYGGFGQLGVSWREWASLSLAASEHSSVNDASTWVRLSVTPPGLFSMGLYWARQNTEPEDFLSLDGSLFASEARLTVWGPLYLHGRYDRLFRIAPDGFYTSAQEWNAGVGAAFPLGGQ